MSLFPGALDWLTQDVGQRIGQGAAVAADITREHVAVGERSGHRYDDLPRQSSAPGEYPQEQFGPLHASIGYEQTGETTFEVGSIYNPPPEAADLEFRPVADGGRPWLSMAMEDPETHWAMQKAAEFDEPLGNL